MPKKRTHFPNQFKGRIYSYLAKNGIEYSEVLEMFGFTTRQGFYAWLKSPCKTLMKERKEAFRKLKLKVLNERN